jgi:(2Fe-2S) ferredoxin
VKQLSSAGLEANTSFPSQEATRSSTSGPSTVNVACISHIGGHAWAGNVIIYNGGGALKKTGIWYGRVEPRHVEYIIRETVLEGRVLGELFRGGVGV